MKVKDCLKTAQVVEYLLMANIMKNQNELKPYVK